ncbi:TonB family protein [Providencia rettgeri]|nr:TonB family protein [Providencia rettgeri]
MVSIRRNKRSQNQHATSDTNSQLINAYREKLRQEVERNKQYPRRAKNENRGIATIQFQLSQNGEISLIRLASSSGNDSLDQAALLAVQKPLCR